MSKQGELLRLGKGLSKGMFKNSHSIRGMHLGKSFLPNNSQGDS